MLDIFFDGESNFTASSLNPAVFQLLAMCDQLDYSEKLNDQIGDETGAALIRLAKRQIGEIIKNYVAQKETKW